MRGASRRVGADSAGADSSLAIRVALPHDVAVARARVARQFFEWVLCVRRSIGATHVRLRGRASARGVCAGQAGLGLGLGLGCVGTLGRSTKRSMM